MELKWWEVRWLSCSRLYVCCHRREYWYIVDVKVSISYLWRSHKTPIFIYAPPPPPPYPVIEAPLCVRWCAEPSNLLRKRFLLYLWSFPRNNASPCSATPSHSLPFPPSALIRKSRNKSCTRAISARFFWLPIGVWNRVSLKICALKGFPLETQVEGGPRKITGWTVTQDGFRARRGRYASPVRG